MQIKHRFSRLPLIRDALPEHGAFALRQQGTACEKNVGPSGDPDMLLRLI